MSYYGRGGAVEAFVQTKMLLHLAILLLCNSLVEYRQQSVEGVPFQEDRVG